MLLGMVTFDRENESFLLTEYFASLVETFCFTIHLIICVIHQY
jgi:hypothetical protein